MTLLILSAGFLLSFSLGLAMVRSQFVRARLLTRRNDLIATQAMHRSPTPRLGGVAVLSAFVMALLLIPSPHVEALTLLLLAGLPLVAAGALEDTGTRITPAGRLLAAAGSAFLAVLLLGVWIPVSGIAPIDLVFAIPALAICFTLVWVAGVCHGFNLIDGVNGLAAGLALLIAIGLSLIALRVGQPALALASIALLPALLGFLVLNWPLGRIFLGDAGAYGLGFYLVWLAILLASKAPEASTPALALMFFWPVADTFLAIARRRASGRRVDSPDRLHFHQLVFRLLSRSMSSRFDRVWINSLAGVVTLLLAAVPVIAAVFLADKPLGALVAWAVFGGLFVACYGAGIRHLKRRRRKSTEVSHPPTESIALAQTGSRKP